MWFLVAILALPIIEIALFVQFGPQIGVLGTLGEVAFTAVLGVVLMRREPQRNAADLRAALEREQSPASPLAHSAMRMLGAVLLVLPGFFTDTLGLLLLVPPIRTILLTQLLAYLHTTQVRTKATIIEGDYTRNPTEQAARHEHISAPEKRD